MVAREISGIERANVNDLTGTAAQHPADHPSRHEKGARQIHVDYCLPGLERHRLKR